MASSMAVTRKVGLIGGLALRAGVYYYEQIARRVAAETQSSVKLVLAHADVNTVLACVAAKDNAALGEYLGSMANELAAGGAAFVAITAVAPHMAIGEMTRVARVPIVNVLDLIHPGLTARGLRKVAIFGNKAVMESRVYGAVPEDAFVSLDESLTERIHTTYTDIALHGKRGTQAETAFLEAAARDAAARGADAVLLAGTDLSSFYADVAPTYPFLDVAQLHIDKIVTDAISPT